MELQAHRQISSPRRPRHVLANVAARDAFPAADLGLLVTVDHGAGDEDARVLQAALVDTSRKEVGAGAVDDGSAVTESPSQLGRAPRERDHHPAGRRCWAHGVHVVVANIHACAEPLGGGVPVLDIKLIVARLLYVVDLSVFDPRVGVEEGVLYADVCLACAQRAKLSKGSGTG
jgi:hypothetical protein